MSTGCVIVYYTIHSEIVYTLVVDNVLFYHNQEKIASLNRVKSEYSTRQIFLSSCGRVEETLSGVLTRTWNTPYPDTAQEGARRRNVVELLPTRKQEIVVAIRTSSNVMSIRVD